MTTLGYSPRAYITLLYNDAYLLGVLVVAEALKSQGCTYPRLIMVTSQVSQRSLDLLAHMYDEIIQVNGLESDESGQAFQLLGRPELGLTFTKIHAWNQTRYSRLVYLDADTLPVCNIDGLFDQLKSHDPRHVAAAPDIGWPDIFNSGVLVLNTSKFVFNELVARSRVNESFDGGDQGLLNQYFSGDRWFRLPFTFNVTPSSAYQYQPAYRFFKKSVSIIHFTGDLKPWFSGKVDHRVEEMTGKWNEQYNAYLEETGQNQQIHDDDSEKHGSSLFLQPQVPIQTTPYYPPSQAKFANVPVQPEPEIAPEKLVAPSADRWDATKFLPPRGTQPEAAGLVVHHYANVWDVRSKEPEREFPVFGESRGPKQALTESQSQRLDPTKLPRRKPGFAPTAVVIEGSQGGRVTVEQDLVTGGRSRVNPPVRPPTPGIGLAKVHFKEGLNGEDEIDKDKEEDEEEEEEKEGKMETMDQEKETSFVPPLLGVTTTSLPFESTKYKAERVFPEDMIYGVHNLQFNDVPTDQPSQGDADAEADEEDEVDRIHRASSRERIEEQEKTHSQLGSIRTNPVRSTSVWDNDPNIARYMSRHDHGRVTSVDLGGSDEDEDEDEDTVDDSKS
jgi:glycogenin